MPLLAGFLALSPCLASASPFSTTGPGRTAWILQPSATSIFTLFFDGPGFRPPHQNLSLPAFFETALPLASLDDAPGADASHHSDPYPSLLFGAVGLLSVALLICAVTLYRQRALRKRLALQSQQILETKAILVEAQRNAHLGIWRYDTKNKSLVCSEETLRILDRGGSRGSPTYFRLLTSIPKTERALVHRALRGVLRDGIPCEITATCRTRQALRILHATAQPTRNKEGAVTGLFGTVQDITRQKAAEEGLRAREQLLRALYENVPTAMGVIEEAGSSFRFISANPSTSRLLGLHSTSVVGRSLADLPLPANQTDFWTSAFRQGIEQRELHKVEQHCEPTKRYYSITLVPLARAGADHRPRQLCFLIDDVTEHREIDAEISQGRRLRAIGELVGGIAHEFNNLLTPIMLKSELLACEWAQDPRLLDEVQTISRAAKRGADLTRRLLTFGRRADIRPEELHLHAAVLANFDLLRPTIDRRITLVSEVPDSLPALLINASALHQIILNLLLNARDTLVDKLNQNHDPAWEARITVQGEELGATSHPSSATRPPSSWIVLTIRDNGMGMTPEVQERIFEPFYTTKEVGKGTGLGLATVWNLTSRLGGKITVESEPGTGSAFHIRLPVITGKIPARESRPPIDVPDEPRTTASILLVEDDELVAATVVAVLKRMGHRTTHIANGSTAWRHLQQNLDYDLLLLDLNIPGISGLEIARLARAANYRGRILIASGRLGDDDAKELDSLHADLRLQKPFTPQVLATTIQKCLGAKFATQPVAV